MSSRSHHVRLFEERTSGLLGAQLRGGSELSRMAPHFSSVPAFSVFGAEVFDRRK